MGDGWRRAARRASAGNSPPAGSRNRGDLSAVDCADPPIARVRRASRKRAASRPPPDRDAARSAPGRQLRSFAFASSDCIRGRSVEYA